MPRIADLKLENILLDVDDLGIATVTLNRPTKRNALNEATIDVLRGAGDHFSAGLDLVEHHAADRSPSDFMHVCLHWHEAFNKMEYGGVPIIAALQGAVVGGGLELASAAHIRVIDNSTYFGLPEGQRGLFTGGGATIRVADLIGKSRMIDMMLTGRLYRGEEAVTVGLANYMAEDSLAKAYEIARRCAENLPLTNFAICSAISHMQNMSPLDASYAESVVAGVVNTQPAARERLAAFRDGSGPRIKPTQG